VGLQDKGASAENVIELGRAPTEALRPSRSRWAAEDTIPALTQRIAELEAQVSSLGADLEDEQRRLATYAEFERSLKDAVADAYRSAEAMRARAEAEANEILRRAVEERRMLTNEVTRLREERDQLHDEIASLRRGSLTALRAPIVAEEALTVADVRAAVADAMRSILAELLAEVRATERQRMVTSAPPAPIESAAPPRIEVAEPEAQPSEPIIDIEELPRPEPPPAQAIAADVARPPIAESPVEFTELFAQPEPAFHEDVEVLPRPEPPPTAETEVTAAPLAEMPVEFTDVVESPSAETAESDIAAAEPEQPIVDEYVEELPKPEEFLPPPSEAPAPTSASDVEALWDAALPTSEIEEAAPPPAAPASSIADELIEQMQSLSVPDSPVEITESPARAPAVEPDAPPAEQPAVSQPAVVEERGVRQIQLVLSPIHSFPQLLQIQQRIGALSTVRSLQLRDFRNGVATYAVGIGEAISALEFGAVVQMLGDLRLQLEGASENSVELRLSAGSR
jgi:hypothetical protein